MAEHGRRPLQSKTTEELAAIAERLRKLRAEIDYRVSELEEELRARQEYIDHERAERNERRNSS